MIYNINNIYIYIYIYVLIVMITLIYALIMIMIIVITIIINNNNNKGHWGDPWLKKRIENLRKDIKLLGRDERREPRRKRNDKIKEAEGKYRLEKKDWSW